MINDPKPYPEYKPSGLRWMGEIPSHWEIERGKWLFRKMDRPTRASDEVVTCFRDGVVTLRKNRRVRGFTESIKEIGYQGIRRGDLVIHAMDAFAGAAGVSDSEGKGSPVYSVCQSTARAEAQYYAHLIREMSRSQWILALAKGIRERSTDFRFDDFGVQHVPLPSRDEQSAIVRFLRHAEVRIRGYVRAKQKLLRLLEEQKIAIVAHAVTKGLAANSRLRYSGVDWLGNIPEHWGLRRLKFLADIKTGGRDTVDRKDGGTYPFFVRSQTVEQIDTYSFDGEAVLTAGDGAGVAKVFHYFAGKFDYHQRVYKFSNFRHVIGKFFFHYFSSLLKFEAFRETAKSTVDSLRLPMLQNFPVVLPPLAEQEQIVEWIENETVGLTACKLAVTREITLVGEYLTSLVANTVTGKLDVRAEVLNLPKEIETFALEEMEGLGENDGVEDNRTEARTATEAAEP